MGSVNDTKSKIVFKKRAHRPWQPSLLEGMEEAHNVVDATPKLQDKQHQDKFQDKSLFQDKQFQENQLEFLQKQLETTLAIKSKEHETLSQNLNTVDDHRITLGGFLRPKDILMVTEQASLQKSASLISELKEKEHEIQTITQHLKISQAEEFVKRAEAARLISEQARHSAEEKAIFALRQAQATAEQAKTSEEKAQSLEQIKSTLEQIIQELQDKLQVAHQEREVLEQKTISDAEQRFRIEQDLRNLAGRLKEQQHSNQSLEEYKQQLTQKLESENHARVESEKQLFEALNKIDELESLIEAAKASYEQSLATEKESNYILEQNLAELQTKFQYLRSDKDAITFAKEQSDEKLAMANLRINKMQEIIKTERNLRVLFEAKVKETLVMLEKSELRRRLDSEACKLAEEKAKSTFEQAGKAMLQLLHNPPAVS